LRRSELILHCGDLSSLSFLHELLALGPPLHAVYGNADEPALRETLPKELVVAVDGARLGLLHIPGPRTGRHARLVARFPHCDAVIYGHTHLPELSRHEGVWILNPGSPTERRTALGRSMLMLEIAKDGAIRPQLHPLA